MGFLPLDYFRRAEEAGKRGDRDQKIDILKELVSLYQLVDEPSDGYAEALRWLGNVYQEKNDIPRAHSYRIAASKVVDSLGSRCSPYVAMCVAGDLGRSFMELREWERAEEHTRHALSLAETMGDDDTARSGRCIYRVNLGLILANTGRTDEAVDLAERVLLDGKSLEEPHYILALQNGNLASMHLNARQLNLSQKHARRAMVHAELCRNDWIKRISRKVLGESYARAWRETGRGEYATEGERLLNQVSRDASQDANFALVADTELELAHLAAGKAREDVAALHCERAVEALEKTHSVLGFEEFSQSYFSNWEVTYERVTEVHLRRQNPAAAFLTSEQSRSRLLLARLGSARPNIARWTAAERAELENVLSRYGTEVIRSCRSELTRGYGLTRTCGLRSGPGLDVSSDPQGIVDARAAYIQMCDKQRLYSAHWTNNLVSPTASHSQVQSSLGPDDVMIVFQVCENCVIAFALTTDRMLFQQVPYSRANIARDVQQICDTMASLEDESLAQLSSPTLRREWWSRRIGQPHPKAIEQLYRDLLRSLEKLFAVLISPLFSLISQKRNWVIVPHGPLHRVPWAALWTGSRYVVEEHNVGLLPSASFAAVLNQTSARPEGKGALLFGAPDPPADPLWLKSADAELESAKQALRLSEPPVKGTAATKESFQEHAPRAGLVHVAAHHFFDGSAPGLSFLKLTGDDGSRFVYACEVAEMQLAAQLVVLSACDTARSYVATGDEQYGMVRSFLAAGGRSVISTLWAIEDESASRFFSKFYDGSRQAPLIEALADTQRAMMKTAPYDLPYFWAPYVLSGEWNRRLTVPGAG
jgi:CHAT domain-containing protein/tetratricopeptide (TPR) repeat protein